MEKIISSKKMENGIVVFWLAGNDRKWESFNYQELIDMRINAVDLLDHPEAYRIDTAGHTIMMKK